MSDEAEPGARSRIDAAELNWVEVTDGGERVCLRMIDRDGRPASVSLPLAGLAAALPAAAAGQAPGAVHAIDGWSLGQDDGRLVLNLRLADGSTARFAIKPWQLAAMASIAAPGLTPRPARLH